MYKFANYETLCGEILRYTELILREERKKGKKKWEREKKIKKRKRTKMIK